MKSVLVFAGLLSVGVLLTGCDKAPPSTNQQSVATEAPEKQVEDLSMFDVRTAVPIDAEWYQKAATQGNADAQFNLGVMYANGEGVSKDAAKAVEWYQKAAAQGNAGAQNNLGVMYATGEGVSKDAAKAVEWYQKAATQGDADAQLNLGAMYLRGEGVPKEVAKAVEWYQKAATQGNADAQHKLGWMYFYGEGVPTDAAKAVECWQKAAAQGNVRAQNMLALSYEIGQGVPKDAAKAVEWYQKAAAQGNVGAQYNLGRLYANDKGVPEDKVLAYAWSNLAGSRGQRIAVLDRADVERRMSAAEIAEAQRLSSSWKQGQILAREGQSASASGVPSATPGSLSKKRTGTLFLVSAAGQAITNHHVVAGCGELRVEGRDGLAKVVTEDVINDLALVQVPGEVKASAAITAEPGKLRQGEDIVVFGFPLNAVLSSGGNLTPGVVSALTGLGNNTNQIQITAPIQPGSSGSPVLNKKGEVVAVVSMKLSDSAMAKATGQLGQNVNFAVNGQTLKSFLDTHKVTFRSGAGFFSWDKSTADLADEARDWTLLVQCWK